MFHYHVLPVLPVLSHRITTRPTEIVRVGNNGASALSLFLWLKMTLSGIVLFYKLIDLIKIYNYESLPLPENGFSWTSNRGETSSHLIDISLPYYFGQSICNSMRWYGSEMWYCIWS